LTWNDSGRRSAFAYDQATPVVQIVADDRENAGWSDAELRRRNDGMLEVRRLAVGDFLVEDNSRREKDAAGLRASVIDRGLFKQNCAMQSARVGACSFSKERLPLR